MKKSTSKKLIFVLISVLLTGLFCSINDPVDRNYFNDINRIKGKNKPEPEPVISGVNSTLSGTTYSIEIDFHTTSTIDPDTGNSDNLVYFLYYSFTNPADFTDPREYYNELRLVEGLYLREADFPDPAERKFVVLAGQSSRRVYFWITAMDDGRESDHSNIEYTDI